MVIGVDVVVVSSSNQSPSEVFRGFGRRSSQRFYCQCGRLRRAVEKVMGVMRRITTVMAMVARCRVDSLHVLIKAVTGAQLCKHSSCLPWRACSAVAMGGGRPFGSFDELLSMAVLTVSWWMQMMADLQLALLSGSSARHCWMLALYRSIKNRRRSGRSSGGL